MYFTQGHQECASELEGRGAPCRYLGIHLPGRDWQRKEAGQQEELGTLEPSVLCGEEGRGEEIRSEGKQEART